MGFTGVVWESRSTEQLARDLTNGPGPNSIGEAGAAWVRVANGLAEAAADYQKLLEKLGGAWQSDASQNIATKLSTFGEWMSSTSLNAAANGQKAEEAAVANTVAVLAMPSVPQAVESKARHDMMASLAAYNGAVLDGTFAEFDESASADQANAAAVMDQYEAAVEPLATAWEEPPPPAVTNGNALKAEHDAKNAAKSSGGGGGGGGAGAMPPMPLSARIDPLVKATGEAKPLQRVGFGSSSGNSAMGGMGGPMGMGGAGRGGHDNERQHDSIRPPSKLEGGGEAGLSGPDGSDQSWLPVAGQNDSPFTVSNVSWGPTSAIFDELAVPAETPTADWDDGPERTMEKVSDRWVSPPVIGGDREMT